MTEVNPVEEAMNARTQAKKDLACCDAKLARLGLAFIALGEELRFLDRGITRDDGTRVVDDEAFSVRIRPPDGRQAEQDFRLDVDDIGEALRLILARRQALEDLRKSEQDLSNLGHSI